VNFGAFVDLGGVDGLVHVSELSWKHVDHPSEVVQVGQEVEVEVLDVDLERERVSLSLKATQEDPWKEFERKYSAGEIIDGQVTKLVPFGAFVRVAAGIEGLVHISEISEQHIETPESVLSVGDEVRVKVIEVDVPRRRISLSMRQVGGAMPRPASEIEEEAADAVAAGAASASPSSAPLAAADSEIAPVEVTPDGGAGSGASEPPPPRSPHPPGRRSRRRRRVRSATRRRPKPHRARTPPSTKSRRSLPLEPRPSLPRRRPGRVKGRARTTSRSRRSLRT
jgi:small subunit ribosomal protein S1